MTAADFASLEADIANCLSEIKAGATGHDLERPYVIQLKGMAAQYGPLSAFAKSSGCRVMSPVARNEQTNFEDAIRKGCENLAKHTQAHTGDVCRMIILRLSNAASMLRCERWANWYFKEYPADPVDVILLYEVAVTIDGATDTSSIVHQVKTITGPRFPLWQTKSDGSVRRLPDMRFFVGVVSTQQSKMQLIGDNPQAIDLSDCYCYQRVDVFQRVELAETLQATLSNPASGIVLHAALEQNGAHLMTLSPKFDREKTLLLLP
jgi:hypothetical protein